MKKNWKRILSLVLVVSLLAGMLKLPARAADTPPAAEKTRYLMLVLDISGSTDFNANGKVVYTANSATAEVKKSADRFLTALMAAEGRNYVGLVVFDETARLVSDFTADIESVRNKVAEQTSNNHRRSLAAGLKTANETLQKADPNAEKSVVLVTTGHTNVGEYNYNGRYSEATIGSQWRNSNTQVRLYAYANKAIEEAEKIKQYATIYVLGLFQSMSNIPADDKSTVREIAEFFRITAHDLASSEREFYPIEDPDNLEIAFGDLTDKMTVERGKFRYAGAINEKNLMEAEYYYSDSYFVHRSIYYNASLATMSLCLELSSFAAPDEVTKNWYDPDLKPSDAGYWNDKLCNIKKLLLGYPEDGEGYEGLGFTDFEANKFWESAPAKDSIGVCFARKTIFEGTEDESTLIAVVVRGGGYGSEWASNFTMGMSGDHKGFSEARDNVLEALSAYTKKHEKDIKGDVKLWITGYSRAAITANMVAAKLNDGRLLDGAGVVSQDNIFCYAFEPPQGVLEQNAVGDYRNIFNRVNTNDLVPLVAPSAWGFVRYNHENDRTFPTKYTSTDFDKRKEAMLIQFAMLGFGADYKIEETFEYGELHVDLSKFLPGGDPLYWTETVETDTHTALTEGLDLIANKLLKTRERYQTSIESSLREILGVLMDYDGIMMGSVRMSQEMVLREVISRLQMLFEPATAWYILSPLLSINPAFTPDDRMRAVRERLGEKLDGVLGAVIKADVLIETIGDVIWELVKQIMADNFVSHGNMYSINTLHAFIIAVASSKFQPHFPEVTLAWCRSLDPNYTTDIIESESGVTRLIRINCPVDVTVYDQEGRIVAQIKDGAALKDVSSLICYINGDGERILYLPGDGEYYVELVPTEDCFVTMSVEEHDLIIGETVRLQNYEEVKMEKGVYSQLYIPAISEKELRTHDGSGSSAEYESYCGGTYLYPDYEIEDADIIRENLYFTVDADADGSGGYIYGGGRFICGSFAQLEAYASPGAEFTGWYEDGSLVSEEAVYRFPVYDDKKLEARFTPMKTVSVRFEAEEGGSIQMPDADYPIGAVLALKAEAESGWRFVKWEIEGDGELSEMKKAETELTLSDKDGGSVLVSAVFEKKEETAPSRSTPAEWTGAVPWILLGGVGGIIVLGTVLFLSARKEKRQH